MAKLLTDPRFRQAIVYFECACRASRKHSEIAALALAKYGDHGPDISGCVRAHFPEHVKGLLRKFARQASDYSSAGHNARPPRVRAATMVKLAREIATRDGSGFYGPQPYRNA